MTDITGIKSSRDFGRFGNYDRVSIFRDLFIFIVIVFSNLSTLICIRFTIG